MIHAKFEKRHKAAIQNIIATMGRLRDWTTDRQEKNGTIAIYDAETDVTYTLHRSGYIRHNDDDGYGWWTGGSKRSWQLNRVKRSHLGVERIMANADEQIVILMNAIRRTRLSEAKKRVNEARKALNQAIEQFHSI